MDNTEGCITVFHGVYDDTQCKNVINLIQSLILVFHLFVDAVIMFHTAADFAVDISVSHMALDFRIDGLDKLVARLIGKCDFFLKILECFRLQITECQVIQLYFDSGDTETVRKRCVDLDRLSGFFFLFLRFHILERAHIVQTVGQFDQDYTDILRHRQEHFS